MASAQILLIISWFKSLSGGLTSVVLGLDRPKQEDCPDFEVSLGCMYYETLPETNIMCFLPSTMSRAYGKISYNTLR